MLKYKYKNIKVSGLFPTPSSVLSGKASHGNVALLLGRPAVVVIHIKVFRTTGITNAMSLNRNEAKALAISTDTTKCSKV